LNGVTDRIRAIRKDLSPTAGRIADFIMLDAAEVVHMSVTKVAEKAEASVVGFCRSLGGRGFQQVKIALARDLVQPVQFIHEDLTPEDDTAAVIEKVFQSDLQALRDTQKALDIAAVARAVEAIRRASRVEALDIIQPLETVIFFCEHFSWASKLPSGSISIRFSLRSLACWKAAAGCCSLGRSATQGRPSANSDELAAERRKEPDPSETLWGLGKCPMAGPSVVDRLRVGHGLNGMASPSPARS
jgi:hypothetical protein